jgi:hypothetical protein
LAIYTEISRYLTNQLLIEVYPERQVEYNNTLNGNTAWMLQYLSTFVRDYFYEYNSRPYQSFTVKALNVLHSYANDAVVGLVSELILDIISAHSSLQMKTLRRFVPFRRQTKYLQETNAWAGESEAYRFVVLVGNYGKESDLSRRSTAPDVPTIMTMPLALS